ncbi:unnamed protein product [Schistosoma curassoni]|uniref:Reverse transcriptase domain-containing protein n=1 Tax=Schistosoma curassoni TaxID=6186 RepID=A0A183JXN3_9TREM|nr:unnamed protein product [Schistosoma curassoni]
MDWKEGHLIKIPKKGDLSKCEKYRGITLLSVPGKVFNRVLLNRMEDAVDAQLRDQQAGFCRDRSCIDQIATLRTIVEQSVEWNSSLYINFIDYEKAFDSVDRITLWKLLRHYGVPEKIFNIIRNSYDGLQYKVWIMKTSTSEGKHGIQWTAQNQLDDLDLADDLALLSLTHKQMQMKTISVGAAFASVGLNIRRGKSKILKYNTENTNPITLDGETLEDMYPAHTWEASTTNKEDVMQT